MLYFTFPCYVKYHRLISYHFCSVIFHQHTNSHLGKILSHAAICQCSKLFCKNLQKVTSEKLSEKVATATTEEI